MPERHAGTLPLADGKMLMALVLSDDSAGRIN
jgi:hypothetical protein